MQGDRKYRGIIYIIFASKCMSTIWIAGCATSQRMG